MMRRQIPSQRLRCYTLNVTFWIFEHSQSSSLSLPPLPLSPLSFNLVSSSSASPSSLRADRPLAIHGSHRKTRSNETNSSEFFAITFSMRFISTSSDATPKRTRCPSNLIMRNIQWSKLHIWFCKKMECKYLWCTRSYCAQMRWSRSTSTPNCIDCKPVAYRNGKVDERQK